MSILDEKDMVALKQMVVYWQEAFQRDPSVRERIVDAELANVIQMIGSEKVLHIIAEYVESRS